MPKIKSAFVIFGLTVSATANESHPVILAPAVQTQDKIEAHPQRMRGDLPRSVIRSWDRAQTRYVF